MGTLRIFAILALLPSFVVAATYNTDADPTPAEVQALIDAAVDGDEIVIASGTHEWSSGVSVTGKGITIRGQGGGAILGFSYDLEDFTMGTKTFTMHKPDDLVFIREPVVGETLEFHYPVRTDDDSLTGEVTGWDSGTRVITMDITSFSGAGGREDGTDPGDEDYWVIVRPAVTTLQVASGSSYSQMISMTQDDTHRGFIKDIGFESASAEEDYIKVNKGSSSGKAITVSGCMFDGYQDGQSIQWDVNRGLIFDCSFHAGFARIRGTSTQQGLRVQDADDSEWTTPSKYGTDDTDGLGKLYIEDCIFHGHRDTLLDLESNGRICVRNSIVHSSRFGGHGVDSGNGNAPREIELYNNAYLYKADGTGRDYNHNQYFGVRGGTGIAHSSYVESNASGYSGNNFVQVRVYSIDQKDGEIKGPYSYGDGESTYPSIDYPVPQMPGIGYIDGSGGTFVGASATRQVGEPVPIWIWNLSGNPGGAGKTSFVSGTNFDAYNAISSSEWSNDGGDLLLTETGTGTYLPTIDGARVRFSNGTGSLPTGLTAGTSYYAIAVSIPGKQWKFSETPGGSAIAYTDAGTSTQWLTAADSVNAHFLIDENGDTVEEGDMIFHTTDVPMPGYTEYPYPHWLQQVTQAGASYSGRLRFNGTGAKPIRTDGVGQPIIFDQ